MWNPIKYKHLLLFFSSVFLFSFSILWLKFKQIPLIRHHRKIMKNKLSRDKSRRSLPHHKNILTKLGQIIAGPHSKKTEDDAVTGKYNGKKQKAYSSLTLSGWSSQIHPMAMTIRAELHMSVLSTWRGGRNKDWQPIPTSCVYGVCLAWRVRQINSLMSGGMPKETKHKLSLWVPPHTSGSQAVAASSITES